MSRPSRPPYGSDEWKAQHDQRLADEADMLTQLGVEFVADGRWRFGDVWDYGIDLPALVLAMPRRHLPYYDGRPQARFIDSRRWLAFDHQSAGLSCAHPQFVGTPLDIRPERVRAVKELTEQFYDSQIGWGWYPNLEAVLEYRAFVRERIGGPVDCTATYGDLKEALYPLDATEESLAWMAGEALPADLSELLTPLDDRPLLRFLGFGGWHMYVLGENSD